MPLKVLFVDDEQNVLQGLRRMMRVVRKEWDMSFGCGGAEALEQMEATSFDVLITDMRMPGMDGATLIAEAAKRHPATIRMVLSGQAEQEATFRLVGSSHQFHSKPCEGDHLIAAVRRVVALRDGRQDESARRQVIATHALPSPAALKLQLDSLLAASEPAVEPLAEAVAADIGLAAKCLQLASTGYFGVGAKVAKAAQAVQLLGGERLAALIADHDLIWSFAPNGPNAATIERIWQRAPLCARLARAIAEAEGLASAEVDAAGAGGLLHESGALLLAAQGQEPGQTEQEPGQEPDPQVAQVGAFLAGLWGLPDALVEAIRLHCGPGKEGATAFDAATAVHAARALLDEQDGVENALQLDHSHLERLGVAEHLSVWRAEAAEIAKQGVAA